MNLRAEIKLNFDNYSVRDVLKHADLGIKTDANLTAKVRKHSVEAYVLKIYKNEA